MTTLSDQKVSLLRDVLNPGLSPDERRDLRQEIPGPEGWLAESVVELEAHPERLALVQEMGRDYYDPAAIADFLLSWPRPLPDEKDEYKTRIAIQDLLVLNPGIDHFIAVDMHAQDALTQRLGDHFILGALLHNPMYQELTRDLFEKNDSFENTTKFESLWKMFPSLILDKITDAYPRKSWSIFAKAKSAAQKSKDEKAVHLFENWEELIVAKAKGKYPREMYGSSKILTENRFRTALNVLDAIMTALILNDPEEDFESLAKSYHSIHVFSKSFLAEFGLSLTKHPLQEIF